MGNKIFQNILDEKIEMFKFVFEQSAKEIFWNQDEKKLLHPGEYGKYRESACKDFLRMIIPSRLDISEGFLLTSNNQTSTQCDIIVFDKNSTPLIENNERQRFFPVETVQAIGEVKSDLTKTELRNAINKLARNKILRESISTPNIIKREHHGQFDPTNYPYDHIFSFIICNEFKFDKTLLVNEIDSMYDSDIKEYQKHNLILSVKDGILLYYDKNSKSLMYPNTKRDGTLKNRFICPTDSINCHFYFFSSYVFMATTASTIIYPEMTNYINFTGGITYNQS